MYALLNALHPGLHGVQMGLWQSCLACMCGQTCLHEPHEDRVPCCTRAHKPCAWQEEFENQKYALEQHILQLEAKQVADGMRLAEAADKDAAVGRLLEVRGKADAAKAEQERAEQHARELQGDVENLRRQVIQVEGDRCWALPPVVCDSLRGPVC